MNLVGWITLLSTLVSLALAVNMATQFVRKKKPAQLMYTIGLTLFTLAVFMEFTGAAFGWAPVTYKIYYFCGVALVAFLASGSVFLLPWRPLGYLYLAFVAVVSSLFLFQTATAAVDTAVLQSGAVTIGGDAMPDSARQYSFILSGIGGMVLILVALFSLIRTRYLGNLFILLGAIVMSAGGRLAATGWPAFLPLSELIGICLLFAGVYKHPGSARHKQPQQPAGTGDVANGS